MTVANDSTQAVQNGHWFCCTYSCTGAEVGQALHATLGGLALHCDRAFRPGKTAASHAGLVPGIHTSGNWQTELPITAPDNASEVRSLHVSG